MYIASCSKTTFTIVLLQLAQHVDISVTSSAISIAVPHYHSVV